MGSKYDKELKNFYDSSIAILNGQSSFKSFDIEKVTKSIIGHMLASASPQNLKQDNDMRAFYKNDDKNYYNYFCNTYSLFCLYYPYKRSIVVLRN